MSILSLYPIKNGSYQQLGGDFSYFDEIIPDDATTMIEIAEGSGVNTYWLTQLTGLLAGVISSVSVVHRSMHFYNNITKGVLLTYGTLYYGASRTAGGWGTYTDTWETNPATGAAWTWEEICLLQAGFYMSGYVDVSTVRVDVTYTLPSADYVILRPNATGSYAQGSQYPNDGFDHYLKVDETVSDDDSTYIYKNTTALETYGMSGLTVNSLINSVGIFARVKSSANPSQRAKTAIITNSTLHYGTLETLIGNSSWNNLVNVYPLNPVTGVAWTIGEVNALEAGAYIDGGNYQANLTQVFVVVYYSPIKACGRAQAIGLIW